jgi:arylsulfatase A-like enzyme
MKRRSFLHSSALTAAALGAGTLPTLAAGRRQPNVIVILTDDQGYGDLSVHGNPIVQTPNIDRLANEGINFSDFHVTPVCTPTRGQLMTGNDALHNLASAVTAGRTVPRRDMPNMAELFRKAGYATGLFGKWHLGHVYPDRPMDRGFDKAVWFKGWGLQSEDEFDNDYVNPRYLDGTVEKHGQMYCTDLWFSEATGWMNQQRRQGKPFFAYIPTNAPHLPMWPPEEYVARYRDKAEPNVAAFFAMISNIDDNVGRLDQWLKDNGIFDDTVVVFLGDNGGTVGRSVYNAGFRDFKSSHYEGGHRAFCFLRHPGSGFASGQKITTPTQVQDMLPTLLDICDVNARGTRFDGTSLVALARRQRFADRMFVVQYGLRDRPAKYDAAVVWNRWRLQKGVELYDIEADRAQKTDVAASHPDIVARMRAFYDAWWARLEPGFSKPIPLLVGSAAENPVMLTCIDWWEVDCDNINFVSQGVGGPRGGVMNLQVETAGDYHIELRRWPFHTGKTLGSEGPRQTIHGRPLTQQVKLMPVREVVLLANGVQQAVAVTPDDTGATFKVKLAGGAGRLQGWFRDAAGADLCGAYYAQVTLLKS